MASSVPKITITQGRLDAALIIGDTRFGVVLDPRDPDTEAIFATVDTLREQLVQHSKKTLGAELLAVLTP